MLTTKNQIYSLKPNDIRLPIRFVIGIAALLISIPIPADNGASDSTTNNGQGKRSANVAVTASPDPDPESSAIANFTIYDRDSTEVNVHAGSLIVQIVEDGLLDGSERTAETPPFRTVQLDVTPLAGLFTPFIDGIAQDLGLEGMSLTSSSKLALTVTITGTHNLIANAVSSWAENQLKHLYSTNDRVVDVADYRTYLQQASNIIGAFGGDEVVGLPPASLRTLLRTREINELHARERDRQSYQLAQSKRTPSAYESYLSEFPNGEHKEDAENGLREARNSCMESAAEQQIVFRDGNGGDAWPAMVVVPGGTYRMGSDERDEFSEINERPIHGVTIPAPFAVGVHEITRGEYDLSGDSVPCWRYDSVNKQWRNTEGPRYDDDPSSLPAVCVSWADAQRYVERLSQDQPVNYRLLSEAEWEYVARAGVSGRRYHVGDLLTACDARFEARDKCTIKSIGGARECPDTDLFGPRAVGCYRKNQFGLFDVHGNVWEWVADTWKENYDESPDDGTAYTASGGLRVLRGGSWADEDIYLRSAMRGRNLPNTRTDFIGFRVARDLSTCPPGVSLSVDRESIQESANDGFSVTVELGMAQTTAVTVELSLSGTATYTTDYRTDHHPTESDGEGSVLTVTIPAGETSYTISFMPQGDEIPEGTENIIVSGSTTGMLVKPTGLALEDDDHRIELSVPPFEFYETSGSVEVTVIAELKGSLPANSDPNVDVALSFAGVAANRIDYSVAPEYPSITIEDGDTTGSVTLTFTPIEDEANEGVGESIEIQGKVRDSVLGVVSALLTLHEH